MKKERLIIIAAISVVLFGSVNAQNLKNAEIEVKVSSQCSMCKATIEKALAFEKGVSRSSLDLETNTVTVAYKPGKTSPEKIRKAISEAGYDADDVAANQKAYLKLPDCCKKPADRHSDHSGHND
ncbi:MAG: cation transporter [Lentimicrobium sp.]|nr:cation transporter [Lentimicrobium sp.]